MGVGEVEVVFGFEVKGDVGSGRGENRDDTLAAAEGTELLGAADLGGVGSGGEEREDYLGAVNGLFDLGGPSFAAVDAGGVEPDVERSGGQIVLEAESEG
jgi:hypothetical protein